MKRFVQDNRKCPYCMGSYLRIFSATYGDNDAYQVVYGCDQCRYTEHINETGEILKSQAGKIRQRPLKNSGLSKL